MVKALGGWVRAEQEGQGAGVRLLSPGLPLDLTKEQGSERIRLRWV